MSKKHFRRPISFLCSAIILLSLGLLVSAEESFTSEKLFPNETAQKEKIDYYSLPAIGSSSLYAIAPDTLSELEDMCSVIVQGTFLQVDSQEIIHAGLGWTWSSIRVDKVFRGNVKPGDILKICEPYYMVDDGEGGKILRFHDAYYPSEENTQYIWFMNLEEHNGEPYYGMTTCERNRYPVISNNTRAAVNLSQISNQELNLSPDGTASAFRAIFPDVAEKYMGIPQE